MIQELQKIGPQALTKPLPLLTGKQETCLFYIYTFFMTHRDYPTHREIAEAMNIQSTNASPYLQPLIRKGYIKRHSGAKRNIRLTGQSVQKLQLMGLIGSE